MRFLIVGAGAVGGYFGARLLAARRDVTFLLRPARAARLAATGLVVRSPCGDLSLPPPPHRLATDPPEPFDVVLLACKAPALPRAIDAMAPFVGPATAVLPLLNGMAHLDALDARFGPPRVLGGACLISATLDDAGRILHLNRLHTLQFGDRTPAPTPPTPRTATIAPLLDGAAFDSRPTDSIAQEMWEKWTFLATLAGITCLMRAAVGDIVSSGAGPLSLALLDECAAIATAHAAPPRPKSMDRFRALLADPASTMTASMLRDIESGAPTEGEHILGNLLARAGDTPAPTLALACAHLRAYEARRVRGTT